MLFSFKLFWCCCFLRDNNYCDYFVIWILKNSSNNIKCASKHRLVNFSGQTINHTGSRVLLILFLIRVVCSWHALFTDRGRQLRNFHPNNGKNIILHTFLTVVINIFF